MGLEFRCPHCNNNIRLKYLSIGEVAECKNCKRRVVVPQEAVAITEDSEDRVTQAPKENPVYAENEIKSHSSSTQQFSSTPERLVGAGEATARIQSDGRTSAADRIVAAGKEYQLASRGMRWWAIFINIIITPFIAAFHVWRALLECLLARRITAPVAGISGIVVIILVTIIAEIIDLPSDNFAVSCIISLCLFGWFFGGDGSNNGQGWAKKLCSIKVINSRNGNPYKFGQSFMRRLWIYLPIDIIDILCLFGAKRQWVRDMLADTLVVKQEPGEVVAKDRPAYKTLATFGILFALGYGLAFLAYHNEIFEAVVKSPDGQVQVQVTVPPGWTELPDLNDDAVLEIGSVWDDLFLIVILENKKDSISQNLDNYSQISTEALISGLETAEKSQPLELLIHNNRAIQHKIRATVKDSHVAYLHTSVEDSQNYYQVIAWTMSSQFDNKESILREAIQSFQTTPR